MNKKGFTMLEMVLSVAIMGILSLAVYNFDKYYNSSIAHIYMQEQFNQIVETELSLAYSNGIDYQEKTIETNRGNIIITVSQIPQINPSTEAFNVKFEMDYLSSDFVIERSKYYDK